MERGKRKGKNLKQRPCDDDRLAVSALADLAATWEPRMAVAAATLRGFVRGSRTHADCERARAALAAQYGPPGPVDPDPSRTADEIALLEARNALCLAITLAGAAPMDGAAWAPLERLLIGHVEMLGALRGIADARDKVRDAWAGADEAIEKNGPDHARLILRGQMVRRLRERSRLTVEELATAATRAGRKFSASQITRLENGTAAAVTARSQYPLLAMGQSPQTFDTIEQTAWDFATQLAIRSARVSGERWFAELVARHGEEGARYFTGVAAVIALQNCTGDDPVE